MPHWFYSIEGKDFGPLSSSKIADAVLSDTLELDSYIISDKDKIWVKVKDVPEIMAIIHKPADHPIYDALAGSKFSAFINAELNPDKGARYEILYYNVSANMLFQLQLLSLGMFQFYWFYRQWTYISKKGKKTRGAWFLGFVIDWTLMVYIIFQQIETDRDMFTVKRSSWNPFTLAVWWYLGTALASSITFIVDNLITGLISGFLSLTVASLVLIPVQRYINEVNEIRKQRKPNILAS
jgi:hypothetical protein